MGWHEMQGNESNLAQFILSEFTRFLFMKLRMDWTEMQKNETKVCKIIYFMKLLENWNLSVSCSFMKWKCFILWGGMKSQDFNEYHVLKFHILSLHFILLHFNNFPFHKEFYIFQFHFLSLYFLSLLFLSLSSHFPFIKWNLSISWN